MKTIGEGWEFLSEKERECLFLSADKINSKQIEMAALPFITIDYFLSLVKVWSYQGFYGRLLYKLWLMREDDIEGLEFMNKETETNSQWYLVNRATKKMLIAEDF